MASFPRTAAEIVELTRRVIAGLEDRADLFPAPPVAPATLEAALLAYAAAVNAVRDAQAAAAQRYAEKAERFTALVDLVKTDLRYAEITAKESYELGLLGWGGRRERRRLGAPGQAISLEIVAEGEGWISLQWKAPTDGGKVAAYRVQVSRERGEWEQADMTVHRNITLSGQPRAVELQYRVRAVNRAGQGLESAVVAAVL